MTREALLNTWAHFSWNFNKEFFLETSNGNYIWSDPDYDGDNTIKKYVGDHRKWLREQNIGCARDKGKHRIGDYCGTDVIWRET